MLRPGDLVVLTGPLGAGKTTLTRGIAAGLGVRGPVQSPTFVIARTHPSLVGGAPLVHVDAYRLGLGASSSTTSTSTSTRSVVVVEWGRGMVDGLRDAWWEVELERERRRARRRHDVRRPLARDARSSTPTPRAPSRSPGGRRPGPGVPRGLRLSSRSPCADSEVTWNSRLS